MSFVSAFFPSDPPRQDWESEGENRLVKQLCNASEFLRGLRVQMRFGNLTRAPLRLLRLQMLDDVVECDWQARMTDPWDADLPKIFAGAMRHCRHFATQWMCVLCCSRHCRK